MDKPMEISIHQAERADCHGRRAIAAMALAVVVFLASGWFGLLAFLGGNAASGTLADLRNTWIPDVQSMPLHLPDLSRLSEVYTTDGVLLGQLTERNSQPVPIDEVPDLVVGAILSAEDTEFWKHNGVDYRAIARAVVSDIGGGITAQGGSTITQQVVKLNFIGTEPTLRRKVAEAAIAIELERRYSKEQILEFYMNSVYFGENAYGVRAAAQEYFGKSLSELTIAEAAALPVPIRNPSLYDLRRSSVAATGVRNKVIDQMVEQKYITAEQGRAAQLEPLVTMPHREFVTPAPQVLIAAKEAVLNDPQYGLGDTYPERKRALFGCPADDTACQGGGGLRIFTTVDFSLQQEAEDILREWFPPGESGPTGAIAMVNNLTGATVVMASGLEFGEDLQSGQRTYDLATKGRRNPGSAFKPFGLVAALENGVSLGSYWADRSPRIIDFGGLEPWVCRGGPADGTIRTLERALIASTNSVFCQLAVAVGPDKIVEVAHRMGIKSSLAAVPAIVLGGTAVSPLEMASAYSTLANYGTKVENFLIERIEDANGNIVFQHRTVREGVLDPALAAAVVRTMEKVVSSGTGTTANIGRPQAGKTGTHQNASDVWFVGFVPQYSTSVWVGFPDSQVPMEHLVIHGRYYDTVWGSSVAAPIWAEFMGVVTEKLPVADFPPNPEGIDEYYQTPKVEIPDVVGRDIKKATDLLHDAGFNVTVEEVNSDKPEDEVVTMDPQAGTEKAQGTEIKLEISNGLSPETPMPSLVGMASGDAVAVLQALSDGTKIAFTWQLVPVVVADPALDGLVIDTNPGPGAALTKDSVVIVTFNSYQATP
jgi:penicillin-binding protein 1A